jgi:PPOX class probable F420-dependent enzyme
MSRRSQIKLTPEEQTEFLAEPRTMSLCTIDKDGYPHVVAMAYMEKDGCIYMSSYGKAQKVLNVRRNPKVAVMIESGTDYPELKGLMIRGRCEIIDKPEEVWSLMRQTREKRGEGVSTEEDAQLKVRAQKRVILKIVPEKVASWDHSKLGPGVY